jgi:hypothetical protein
MSRTVLAAPVSCLAAPAIQVAVERSTSLPVGPSRMLTIAVVLVALVPLAWHGLARGLGARPPRAAGVLLAVGVPLLGLVHLLALARFADGPFGPVPGGPLEGPVAGEQRPDWSHAADGRYVELEIRPERPRSLETLVLVHEGDLYVAANLPERKRWPAEVRADPRVRVRVEERVHPRRARWIADPRRRDELLGAMNRKYGFDVSLGGPIWFFRLDPR